MPCTAHTNTKETKMENTDHREISNEIKAIRTMTEAEMTREGWVHNDPPAVIELADGSLIYPSRDAEGNGPGMLFGFNANTGQTIAFG